MSTRNICHRTSSSTTKQFHIHKNTDNKDICNTNNKLFMLLYNCNVLYAVSYRILVWEGGGLRVHFATLIFWNLHYFDAHLCIYFTLMISVRSYALNGSVMIGT